MKIISIRRPDFRRPARRPASLLTRPLAHADLRKRAGVGKRLGGVDIHTRQITSYVKSDGRIVRVGKKGKLTRYLADGRTLDPDEIANLERLPPKPKKLRRDFIGDQSQVDASAARPGQGCLPDGRDAICGECIHFTLTRPYEGICAFWPTRMAKVKGASPTFPIGAAGPDFAPRARS